jgi:hypothetical protein
MADDVVHPNSHAYHSVDRRREFEVDVSWPGGAAQEAPQWREAVQQVQTESILVLDIAPWIGSGLHYLQIRAPCIMMPISLKKTYSYPAVEPRPHWCRLYKQPYSVAQIYPTRA